MSSNLMAFKLSPTMNHDECGRLAAALADGQGKAFNVDASQVQQIGGRAAQLLVIASQSWANEDVPFTIERPTPQFSGCIRRLGLSEFLLPEGDVQ